jgi:hypothetical protein
LFYYERACGDYGYKDGVECGYADGDGDEYGY